MATLESAGSESTPPPRAIKSILPLDVPLSNVTDVSEGKDSRPFNPSAVNTEPVETTEVTSGSEISA
jgi:hypothetical protein